MDDGLWIERWISYGVLKHYLCVEGENIVHG